jgi:L-lactate dehydrogenase complex protein LldG
VTQTGDRELVLARLRRGTASPPPANLAHPTPEPNAFAPSPRSHLLDDADPVEVFAATAKTAGCTVRRRLDIAELVARHDIRTAVATAEDSVAEAVEALRAAGVTVDDAADRDAAATADLGVTGCRAAVASTGSVVVGSDVPGARWASLLPRVHLCIVRSTDVVAHPGDVLRALGEGLLPANLAFVSGPSRTGDIEQILTRGVHGPVAVEVVLHHPPPPPVGGVH